ncbi:MAG: FAD-dependent oxidoreductase [Planctomycetota bacterium]|nr:FAD-dependent oxidoreductase [Planctomycetota bacterium]
MSHSPDCLILGGGIAGLWTLRTLVDAGYNALLVETAALGHGQTIASQGILHAGTKYALTGDASRASKAAATAAAVWRECLAGTGPIDLRGAAVLSQHTCMFTTPGVGSRLAGLAASKALTSGPQKLSRAQYPAAFADAPPGIAVYQLDEPVLDLPALLETLATPVRDRMLRAQAVQLRWQSAQSPQRAALQSPQRQRRAEVHLTIAPPTSDATAESKNADLHLTPRALVCTAGTGNEALLAALDLDAEIRTQRRPLHMVLARRSAHGNDLPAIHAHCVGLSDKPRATITSATDATGRTVWYIGGTLAESGVDRSPAAQIAQARQELAAVLPWIDLTGVEFATLRVDRAEGFDANGQRPDTPVVRAHANVIACWPTKLVLAPLAACAVLEHLKDLCEPAPKPSNTVPLDSPCPAPALPVWDNDNLLWT